MNSAAHKRVDHDLPGTITAIVFIAVACLALWDTTNMVDADSYVFPRAIAIAMIVFSLVLIFWNLARPRPAEKKELDTGSYPRRIGLVVAMFASTLLMPYIGFLLSGICAFIALTLAAMFDPWTPSRRLTYPLIGIVVVIGFYTLFAKVLQVPLPSGVLFD